jgi:FMN phosphatase YigB (HAD superfamily)
VAEQLYAEPRPFGLDDIDLVVCDIDGVLLKTQLFEDAQSKMALAWANQVPRYGADPSKDIVLSSRDARLINEKIREATIYSNGDPKRHYEKLLGIELEEDFWEFHRWMVKAVSYLQMPDWDGVRMLGELHRAGKYTAAFTSRDRELLTPELAPEIIRSSGSGPKNEGWFDITISADDVGVDAEGKRRMKPDTAGLEIICDTLNVPYERTLMVGDRPSDIIPAKQLGAFACALYNAGSYIDRQSFEDLRPDIIVKSMKELYQVFFETAA